MSHHFEKCRNAPVSSSLADRCRPVVLTVRCTQIIGQRHGDSMRRPYVHATTTETIDLRPCQHDDGYMDYRLRSTSPTNGHRFAALGLPWWSPIQVLTGLDVILNFGDRVTEQALVDTAASTTESIKLNRSIRSRRYLENIVVATTAPILFNPGVARRVVRRVESIGIRCSEAGHRVDEYTHVSIQFGNTVDSFPQNDRRTIAARAGHVTWDAFNAFVNVYESKKLFPVRGTTIPESFVSQWRLHTRVSWRNIQR